MSKKRFKRGEKVHVIREDSFIYPKFEGIVEGSYYSLYGGGESDRDEYSLYIIENGKIVNSLAWVSSHEMTEVEGWDRNIGRDMIEEYEEE